MSINNKFIALLLSDEDADVEETYNNFSPEEQDAFFEQLMEISAWMARQGIKDLPSEMKTMMVVGIFGQMPLEMRQCYLEAFTDEELAQEMSDQWTRRFTKENVHWHAGDEYNMMFIRCQESYLNHLVQARSPVFLNEALEQLGFPRVPIGQTVGWVEGQYVDFNPQQDGEDIILTFNVDEDVWQKIEWGPAL